MTQREHQKKPVGVSRSCVLDRKNTLKTAVPCAACQYNLLNLQSDGMCPECGHPIKESIYDYENRKPDLFFSVINVGAMLFASIALLFWPMIIVGDSGPNTELLRTLYLLLAIVVVIVWRAMSLFMIWLTYKTRLREHSDAMALSIVATLGFGLWIILMVTGDYSN